jgi:hypothetical protein
MFMFLLLPSYVLASPSITLTHSLVKLRPDQPIPSAAIREISAARNEYESFQVAVSVPESNNEPVEVIGIDVVFEPSTVFGADSVLIHRQHYIDILTVSNCDGELGRWPDALIPAVDPYFNETRNAFPISVAPGTNQAFWVDIFVSNDTKPGMYNATVTVTFGSTRSKEPPQTLPLALRVHSFSLPSTSSHFATTFNCDIKSILAGKYLGHYPANLTGAERVALQKQYVDLGLMHRTTFSDFLGADPTALKRKSNGSHGDADPDWAAVEADWADYLGSGGRGVDLQYGLKGARPTTIQLPPQHYPGPAIGGTNRSLIDQLWHATGCPHATPEWGYTYWSGLWDYGVVDMASYCSHSAAGDDDPW